MFEWFKETEQYEVPKSVDDWATMMDKQKREREINALINENNRWLMKRFGKLDERLKKLEPEPEPVKEEPLTAANIREIIREELSREKVLKYEFDRTRQHDCYGAVLNEHH